MAKRFTSDTAVAVMHVELGTVAYDEALTIQRRIMNAKLAGMINDVLLTLEHPPTFTLGRSGDEKNLLSLMEWLKPDGIELRFTDRGGDATYHGPGQLVVYPILDLNRYYRDLHRYLRDLEEVMIRTAGSFGVEAGRIEGLTGVWVGDGKLGAIGIKMKKWITMHGTALNVNTDLAFFEKIVPCGIEGKQVVSLAGLVKSKLSMAEVRRSFVESFSDVFGAEVRSRTREWLIAMLNEFEKKQMSLKMADDFN